MKLICGLGNPGAKYNGTRHNVGFMLVDALADGASFSEKWEAALCEISLNGEKTLLMKPLTYMNLSGKALAKVCQFYKIPLEDMTVVYDDIDLPLGELRFREQGSAGTHNGMKSVIECLGTQAVPRLRIGIESRGTTAPEQMALHDFVLAPFLEEEQALLKESIAKAVEFFKNPLA